MSAVEWLLYGGLVWALFLAYAAVDAPALLARLYRGVRR
jgi:hypothetical protein